MTEYICILCPRGCRLAAEKKGEAIEVTGNFCPRGKEYAVQEMTDPRRTVTTSVYVEKGQEKMLSVKTDGAVARHLVPQVLQAAAGLKAQAPIAVGDVLIENVAGSGYNLVATRNIERKR